MSDQVTFGRYEGFRGCDDRNPDFCACGTHSDPECEGCGETIEDGQEVVTVARVGLPTISPESDLQWWDYHTAHTWCSSLTRDEVTE